MESDSLPNELYYYIAQLVNNKYTQPIKYSQKTEIGSLNHNTLEVVNDTTISKYRLAHFLHYSGGYADLIDHPSESKTGFIIYQYHKKENYLIKILFLNNSSIQGKPLYDGPNDDQLFALCYSKNNQKIPAFTLSLATVKTAEQCDRLRLKYNYGRYTDLFDKEIGYTGTITALAVYKRKPLVALINHDTQQQKIDFYDATQGNYFLIGKYEVSLQYGLIKKLSFLTEHTLLGLTDLGYLVTVAHDEKNKSVTMHKQTVTSNNKEVTVQHFAIDPCNIGQMLLLLEDNQLFLIHIAKREKSIVDAQYLFNCGQIENLWLYNNKGGYLATDSIKNNEAHLITFPTYHFNNELLSSFVQKYLNERPQKELSNFERH